MATAPIKSPLHNFPLSFLQWGSSSSNHRFRRPSDPDSHDHSQTHRNLRPRKSELSQFSAPKSARLRDLAEGGPDNRKDKQIWVSLSKDEIEQDIYAITGSKPSRRPRKRSKTIQKQLDDLFPGSWLVGMSPEVYRKSWTCLM